MDLTNKQKWQVAITWIRSRQTLIRCIAYPYLPYIGCSSLDLESEALLAAYLTFSTLLEHGKPLNAMGRYFRVVFRSRLRSMTLGVRIAEVDLQFVNVESLEVHAEEVSQDIVDAALEQLTNRQREVAGWILNQQEPASVRSVSNHFGLTCRAVRKLLNNAIKRLEHGYQRVQSEISYYA